MNLCDGRIGGQYKVANIALPTNMEKRLEALGMTNGTSVTVLNSKSHGVLIVKVRGTRFPLGTQYHKKYLSVVTSDERKLDNRLHRKSELRKNHAIQRLYRRKFEGGELARCDS